ncbi:hypothetical protein MHH92_23605 [Paenibacillus sp. FSL M7-1414]|uniref:hypothetical protein n=1 Tax=Paenibacillus sp. FSL M7-1414 TaxID=2921542 RepID=UPI0030FC918E
MSEFVSLNWFAWVHLQSLITFRDSEQTMDAGNDWLDKEISDLKTDLGIQEGQTHESAVTIAHSTFEANAI